MAHYVSRLSTRTSKTPSEWLATCSQIGEVVNEWADRNDLVVYAGNDAGIGHTACLIKTSAEMEINLDVAFGVGVSPALVGDFRNRSTQYDFASATGVIYHEALHARYSEWSMPELEKMSEQVFRIFSLLDESRIERLGVLNKPENQVFLRTSATKLALDGLDENAETMPSDIRIASTVALLSLARVDAGVLKFSDVKATYPKVLEVMGKELFDKLRSIWVSFQKLETKQVLEAVALATEFYRLINEADPEPEKPKGKGKGKGSEPNPEQGDDDDNPSGSGSGIDIFKETMEQDASDSEVDKNAEAQDQQTKEQQQAKSEQRKAEQKDKDKSKETAKKIFSPASGGGQNGSRSTLMKQRPPKGDERASAVTLAKSLDKAKYRERSITEVKSVTPQGRLKTRVAIQNSAMKSKGIHSEQPAWRVTKRKHTDDPTLTIGVLVDISGSMSSAMESMATTAWVLSEAGRRVQAKTAMVYYGSGVFPTLKVGQKLEQVSVWSAPDGTEMFQTAFEAIDGELNLIYGSGVRMLVIVSDGHYTSDEAENAKKAIERCKQNGVAVLFITPAECGRGNGIRLVGNNGVVLSDFKMSNVANEIGRYATEALTKISVGG